MSLHVTGCVEWCVARVCDTLDVDGGGGCGECGLAASAVYDALVILG